MTTLANDLTQITKYFLLLEKFISLFFEFASTYLKPFYFDKRSIKE